MRTLTPVLALLACASDPDAPPYQGTNDASVTQCPHVGEPGYAGAYALPDGQCSYRCASTHHICGTVTGASGAVVTWGLCTAYSDPQNCGLCGIRCESGTSCRIVTASRGQYVCVAPGVQ